MKDASVGRQSVGKALECCVTGSSESPRRTLPLDPDTTRVPCANLRKGPQLYLDLLFRSQSFTRGSKFDVVHP